LLKVDQHLVLRMSFGSEFQTLGSDPPHSTLAWLSRSGQHVHCGSFSHCVTHARELPLLSVAQLHSHIFCMFLRLFSLKNFGQFVCFIVSFLCIFFWLLWSWLSIPNCTESPVSEMTYCIVVICVSIDTRRAYAINQGCYTVAQPGFSFGWSTRRCRQASSGVGKGRGIPPQPTRASEEHRVLPQRGLRQGPGLNELGTF